MGALTFRTDSEQHLDRIPTRRPWSPWGSWGPWGPLGSLGVPGVPGVPGSLGVPGVPGSLGVPWGPLGSLGSLGSLGVPWGPWDPWVPGSLGVSGSPGVPGSLGVPEASASFSFVRACLATLDGNLLFIFDCLRDPKWLPNSDGETPVFFPNRFVKMLSWILFFDSCWGGRGP